MTIRERLDQASIAADKLAHVESHPDERWGRLCKLIDTALALAEELDEED